MQDNEKFPIVANLHGKEALQFMHTLSDEPEKCKSSICLNY